MLLSEAKEILKKNGYRLLKEYGPSPDDYDNAEFVADMEIKLDNQLYRIISFKAGTVKLETISENPEEKIIIVDTSELDNAEILSDPRRVEG